MKKIVIEYLKQFENTAILNNLLCKMFQENIIDYEIGDEDELEEPLYSISYRDVLIKSENDMFYSVKIL